MRQALITEKGWQHEGLPCEKTIGNMLNRLGFRLRRVQKAKPLKKVLETDAIFDNLHKINQASDLREDSLRISIDTKRKLICAIPHEVVPHAVVKPCKLTIMIWELKIN